MLGGHDRRRVAQRGVGVAQRRGYTPGTTLDVPKQKYAKPPKFHFRRFSHSSRRSGTLLFVPLVRYQGRREGDPSGHSAARGRGEGNGREGEAQRSRRGAGTRGGHPWMS